MLSYLGGEMIHIFKLKINTWEQTQPNHIVFIHQDIFVEQSFQEIYLIFYCYSKSILVEWILFKDKIIQENSPCSTQIQIQLNHQNNYSIISKQFSIEKKNNYSISAIKVFTKY